MKIIKVGIITAILLMSTLMFNEEVIVKGEEGSSVIIKVAAHSQPLIDGIDWTSGENIVLGLDNYTWTVGDDTYVFWTEQTYRKDLIDWNKLNEFDALIFTGPPQEWFTCVFADEDGTTWKQENQDVLDNLYNFINYEGGGYIGTCASADFPIGFYDEWNTFQDKFLDKTVFIDKDIKHARHGGWIILDEYTYHEDGKVHICGLPGNEDPDPTRIGHEAPMWYSGITPPGVSGYTFDLDIPENAKEHPVFKDYLEDTWRVHGFGNTFNILDSTDVTIMADYPNPCIDGNDSLTIHHWSFQRSVMDLLPYIASIVFGILFESGQGALAELLNFLFEGFGFDGSWEKTTIPVQMNLAGNPAVLAFQEGDGKIIISGPHPEHYYWDPTTSHIEEEEECSPGDFITGLYHWYDNDDQHIITKEDCNIDFWFIRRAAAWSAKVDVAPDDNHLPPIYGRSQVVDIQPELHEEEPFDIDCCVAMEKNEYFWDQESTIDLTLWYRHKGFNATDQWTDWTPYDSIDCTPYLFTFDPSTVEGAGSYEFYSIANLTNDTATYSESAPPGADARCIVGNTTLIADFNYTPTIVYTNDTVYFYDQSINASDFSIDFYQWDFDGENVSKVTENANCTWNESEVFNVTHRIRHDSPLFWSNTTKEIIIYNRQPEANFTANNDIIYIGQTVSFTDNSVDEDGSITNWTWDFGDGVKSYEQNPDHTYSESNFYSVSLKVTDDDNGSNIKYKQAYILVADALVNHSLLFHSENTLIWKNIQKALDNTSYRDIIYVYNGTYTENIIINKSKILIGEDKETTTINGSVLMENAHDFELPNYGIDHWVINMSGNDLLLHFNNDSSVGENYSTNTTIHDYSGEGGTRGEGNNGTFYQTNWTTNAKKGDGAFEFNGINSTINLSSIPALTGENVTISAWIYWKGGSGTYDPILTQSDDSYLGYNLYVNPATDKPTFWLNDTEAISSESIDTGWHNIVGTHNETTLKIYVDGKLKDNVTKTGCGIDVPAFIGFDSVSNNFYGIIDEVAVWNKMLSDSEIYSAYNQNYGMCLESFTVQNADNGIIICNRSEIIDCNVINTSIGIYINCSETVWVSNSCISNASIGVNIIDCNSGENQSIKIGASTIDNVTYGILANSSSYIRIAEINFTNSTCSGNDIRFNDCNSSTISILSINSSCNIVPDIPSTPSGPTLGSINVSYNYSSCTNDSNGDQILYLFDWDDDDNSSSWLGFYNSNETINTSHSWTEHGCYYIKVRSKDVLDNMSDWSDPLIFKTEEVLPEITNVTNSPDTVGFGFTVNITADITDNLSGVDTVYINISSPDGSSGNYSMEGKSSEFEVNGYYLFNDTWLVGQYNYTIWAVDNAENTNSSTGHSFNVSANATINIATLKDNYTNNEYINITDPPNPPEGNWTIEGDSVYLDTENAYLSVTPHTITSDGWAEVELESKQYSGTIDFLFGFNTAEARPTNLQLWKNYTHDLTAWHWIEREEEITFCGFTGSEALGMEHYGDYGVEYGNENNTYLYRLEFNEGEHTLIIAFNDYEINGDCITMTYMDDVYEAYQYQETFWDWQGFQGDIDVLHHEYQGYETWYRISANLQEDVRYKARAWIDVPFRGLTGAKGKYWFGMKPHGESIQEAIANHHFYYLDPWWNASWNHYRKLTVNASFVDADLPEFPVLVVVNSTIGTACDGGDSIRFVTTDNGTELPYEIESWNAANDSYVWVKTDLSSSEDTSFYMYYNNSNASDGQNITGVWNDHYIGVWHMSEQAQGARSIKDSTWTRNGTPGGNPTYEQSGKVGYGVYLDGESWNEDYFTITHDAYKFANQSVTLEGWWKIDENRNEYETMLYFGDADWYPDLWAAKHRSGLQDGRLFQTRYQSVTDGAVAIGDGPGADLVGQWIYQAGVVNYQANNLSLYKNATRQNDGGTCEPYNVSNGSSFMARIGYSCGSDEALKGYLDEVRVSDVARNSSWLNATFHTTNQSDGFLSIGEELSFLQSKITNTGSTNISGYLLIQVQYFNTTLEDWVVDNDTINETTPRIINVSEQLALDLIFNGLVNTDDLVNGNGTYRVYAAFRDPNGNLLIDTNETELEAWYNFEIPLFGVTETSIDPITPYTITSSPLTINATGLPDLDNVSLWYRNSTGNISWNKTFEYYTTGDNDYDSLFSIKWHGQTFTIGPMSNYSSFSLTHIKLKMFRVGNITNLSVSIKATDEEGKPTGDDLSTGTIDASTFTTDIAGDWYQINMSHIILQSNITYAIVCHITEHDPNSVGWRLDNSNPSYNGGSHAFSSNGGWCWGLNDSKDFLFEIYGDWQEWENSSNPDDFSPWSWEFDFPDGNDYYEFYSLGKKEGCADESPPESADAICRFISS